MLVSVLSLAIIGFILGLLLGIASRFLAVDQDPLENEIRKLLAGSNCGQCGFVGCDQAAKALVEGKAKPSLCPPGGKSVAEALAKKLGVPLDKEVKDVEPVVSQINENLCIGCTRCIQVCSTDAIVGAPKMIHCVIENDCHGCGKCEEVCPVMAITLRKIEPTIVDWYWPKPKEKIHEKSSNSRICKKSIYSCRKRATGENPA